MRWNEDYAKAALLHAPIIGDELKRKEIRVEEKWLHTVSVLGEAKEMAVVAGLADG